MIPIRARAVLLLAAGLNVASASSIAAFPAETALPAETENATNDAAEAQAPPAEVRVLRTGGLRVETAALLWSGQQGGPVAIAARAIAIPGKNAAAPDKVKIALVVEASGSALAQAVESDGLATLPVDVAIYALDARGALVASLLETVEIPEAAETLRQKGFRFVGGFALRPGSYSLRLLVGHAASKTIGLRVIPVTVPAAGEPARLGPGFSTGGDSEGPWLTAFSLDAAAQELPSLWLGETPYLAFELIPPGDPARSLVGREAGSGSTATVGLPGATGADDADAPGHWRRSEAAALRATYARILARWNADDEAKTREEIAAFEVPLLSGPKAASREELTGLEGTVLRTLERRNPESLVPLMALYRTLHGDYQKRNQRQPAMHAVILVGSLAELYVRAVPTPEAKRLAAGFLVSLTPNLDRSGLSSLVEAELKRALELDPDQPQALLGQAQGDERHGRYAAAVAGLERLTALGPTDPEVAVRLAVNTARLGRAKRARELLGKIVAPLHGRTAESPKLDANADAWPLALACQELARLEIAAKDPAAAGRALSLGLASFPEDEKLLLLAAALADLPGAVPAVGAAAKEKLAQWTPQGASGISPRLRYDQLPRRRIEALWLDLERAGKERLPTLAAALGPDGKTKGAR
ncbi:MAG TPA: hypothetical protein VN851_25220 [Thermoanaerobaculia bacterium]|nr:hypothetical protein [Thermoanaerobaculia bacterium]